jgi:hypothetical protein
VSGDADGRVCVPPTAEAVKLSQTWVNAVSFNALSESNVAIGGKAKFKSLHLKSGPGESFCRTFSELAFLSLY